MNKNHKKGNNEVRRSEDIKRKGFTLVELLAVIVILAIISLIATPIILGVIDTAKEGAAKSSALGYLDAIEKQIMLNQLDSTKTNIADGVYDLPMNDISVKGELPSEGWVKIENSQIVNYSMKIMDYIVTKDSEISKEGSVADKPSEEVSYICKRATTLHTEECTQTSNYCYAAGYVEGNKGTTITYGNGNVTEGVLTSGDAFDCDVNGDGIYNSENERFYYVSELSSNTEYAVLLYSNNTKAGVADNTEASLVAYNSSGINYEGPVTGITNLPTITQWSNISLSNTSRAITNENGEPTTDNGNNTIPAFSYEGYAARLLTAQEVNSACGITVGSPTTGELDGCNYLMENTKYSSSSMGTYGYWLETPYASDSYSVWILDSYGRIVSYDFADDASFSWVRPAIEVLKSDISY